MDDRSSLREAMVGHAEKMIVAGGLSSLTARSLAKDMNIAVGTTYNVVANLDELVLLVNLNTFARLNAELGAVSMQGDDVEQALMNYTDCYIGFVENNQALWSAVFQMRQAEISPELRVRAKDQIAELFGYIETALAPLLPNLGTRRLAARSLWAAVHGILSLAGDEETTLTGIGDVRATINHLVHCYLLGLRTEQST
jgi:AcrR family transcriptional regulator